VADGGPFRLVVLAENGLDLRAGRAGRIQVQGFFIEPVGERTRAHGQIMGVEVVAVVVGDQAVGHGGQVQAQLQYMQIGVRRKIDQELFVDDRLGTGAEVASAGLAGPPAVVALAKQAGPAFGGGGA